MKQCSKCLGLLAKWLEANQQRTVFLKRYGPIAEEALLASCVEAKARRKLVAHSVDCTAPSIELMELIMTEVGHDWTM
jgi:hypothetical protein